MRRLPRSPAESLRTPRPRNGITLQASHHPMTRARPATLLLLLALLGWLCFPSLAQPSSVPPTSAQPSSGKPAQPSKVKSAQEQADELQERAFKAIAEGNYAQAAQLLREQIKLDPGNFVPYYNLACALSLDDQSAASADALADAIEHGFVDLDQLRRDPQLTSARRDPRINKLIAAWPTVLDRHFEANLRATTSLFNDPSATYQTTRDEKLRIALVSAM